MGAVGGYILKLTIKNILKKTDGNQELFTWIYDRTIELFNSTYLDNEQIKQTIENKIKNFDLDNYSKYLDKFSKELENPGEDRGKFSILFFDAINLLKFSYTYCFTEHNLTVINLLQQLAYLERSCADYNARKLTKYWIDVERSYNKAPRSTGGKIKAEKQAEERKPKFKAIEELWDTGKWKNPMKCANDIFNLEEINLPHTTVYNYLRNYKNSKNDFC